MSDWPPLRDYSGSLAVLMGTWDYKIMTPVPAARYSLERIKGVLAGPLCGWPQDRIRVLDNQSTRENVSDLLITVFSAATDVAVFYFVGHGQISPDDQLCLGLTNSVEEPDRRVATSLPFNSVRQALDVSPAAVKIVILDCCFAGLAAPRNTLSGSVALADEVLEQIGVNGAYTMAAAAAKARYQIEPGLERPQTYFTKYLVDLIEKGIPGQPAQLKLDPLFKQLEKNLRADRMPVPQKRGINNASEFMFAHNAAPLEVQRDPERELAAANTKVSALEAEIARLMNLLANPGVRDAGQQRELQEELHQAARQLDSTLKSKAALTITHPRRPASGDGQGTTGPAHHGGWPSPPQPASPYAHSRGPRRLLVAGLACAIGAAVAVPLLMALPGAPHTPSHAAGRTPARTPSPSGQVKGTLVTKLSTPASQDATSVAFGPRGRTLAAAAADANGNIYLWDISARKVTATFADPADSSLDSLAFRPGGSVVAGGDADGSVYVWKTATQLVTVTISDPSSQGVNSVAFGRGGTLAAGDGNGHTYLWNSTTGKRKATLSDPSSQGVNSVAFGPGGTLAAGDANGHTYLWNSTTGKKMATLLDPSSQGVKSVAFGPGSTLAAADQNGTTYLWDTRTRKPTATLLDPSSQGVKSVAFGPGTMLAAADQTAQRTCGIPPPACPFLPSMIRRAKE